MRLLDLPATKAGAFTLAYSIQVINNKTNNMTKHKS